MNITTELLPIEQAFLNLPEIKAALMTTEISRVNKSIKNAQKSKFGHTLKLAKLVVKANDYFESTEGKAKFAEEGIVWTKGKFISTFPWNPSFYHKVVKVGKIADVVVELFESKCNEAEAEGKEVERSVAALIKFASGVETEINEASGEEEITEESLETAELAERAVTIFTLSYKGENGNVAVRVEEDGKLITTNERAQILDAIEFLMSKLA